MIGGLGKLDNSLVFVNFTVGNQEYAGLIIGSGECKRRLKGFLHFCAAHVGIEFI